MEKENIGPKSWTTQGEVTAAKKPKNRTLEVDLDFEHNVRPAPVITELKTSIEDMIKKIILQALPGALLSCTYTVIDYAQTGLIATYIFFKDTL